MNLEIVAEFLERTIADGQLSRGERSAFRRLLDDGSPSETEMSAIRAKAFELARSSLIAPEEKSALEWLESVNHLMAAADRPDRAGGLMEVLFSPGEACRQRIQALFNAAREDVRACLFTITDDAITAAIVAAFRRGVRVRIVSDNDKADDLGSDLDRLRAVGVEIAFDTSPNHMHHKFALFDGGTVLSGSYNWTRAAARANEENLIVSDYPRLISVYGAEFDRLWRAYAL